MSLSRQGGVSDALQTLGLSQARWQAVLDSAQDAIVSIDQHGTVTLFNRAAERIFGYPAEEVLGRNVTMVMPAPYRDEHAEYVARYERTGTANAIGRIRDVYALRKSGEVFPIELSVSEARFGDEVIYSAIIRDVTERRRLEAASARLAAIVESSEDAIISKTLDGTIISWNRAAEWLYGYSAEEMVGRSVSVIFPPEQRNDLPRILERLRRGERIGRFETVRLRKDGTRVRVLLAISQIKDASGTIIGASTITHDITELRRAHAELLEYQRRAQQDARLADVGAITTQVVHDIGNPLAAISMQAQLLLRRLRKGHFVADDLLPPAEQVLNAVQRLHTVIREFGDFVREQRLNVTDIALPDVLEDLRNLWIPLATSRDIDLVVDLPACFPPLRADEQKLRRVIENLIKNAIEAIEHGPGRVTILAARIPANGKIRLSIADTGPGIDQGIDVFRLFETTKPGGTGLGLAIAKQIIIAHGGDIHHESLAPHGTVFHLDLPIHERAM